MRKLKPLTILGLFALTGCSGSAPALGVKNGKLTACPQKPNCVNSQAIDSEHYIEPIAFAGTQEEAKNHLLTVLGSEDNVKILVVEQNYIRAEFTSSFFRFIDDVEFYFPVKQSAETLIEVRSASRIGYSDLGANKKRIHKIRAQF